MIYLGADHGGFELKEKIKSWLTEWKYQFEDLGAYTNDPEDDYPQFAFAVAEKVGADDVVGAAWQKRDKGIVLCRSAGGVIIAANKVAGVRAVAVFDEASAKHAREHNDANVVGISGDRLSEAEAKKIVKVFIETSSSAEPRHRRRVEQIMAYESNSSGGCACGDGGCGHC